MSLVRRGLIIALSAAFTVTACGDDTPDATATTPPAVAEQYGSLSELLDAPAADDGATVVVSAIFFDDGSGPLMCEVLAESFPPQCMGRTLGLVNADLLDVDWTEHEGTRWTDRAVDVLGWVDGDNFVVT